ncbi:helix-turn-helix transcriptional regulator [Ktedonospora formicarum]|uniref:helix-turn-helix transcriptional regulator n=1 Tax=Ktedonospora formicarum TaxID=2778364 RepID=UPI001C68F05B|nr:helix-turn-helix transcriptional regulator [Ktedonospora formicarum]
MDLKSRGINNGSALHHINLNSQLKHIPLRISRSPISQQSCIRASATSRLFKKSVGFTPHRYFIQRRIERAKPLFLTTNWSLTAIAHMIGFVHESHLDRHFKRLTRLTPKHYQ